MSTEPLLEAVGVAKRYGAVAALRDAALSIRPGEVHALMGANGAGKSTLVKILTGAVRADAGRISIRGEVRQSIRRPTPAAPAWCRSTRNRRWSPTSTYQPICGSPARRSQPFRAWVRELGIPDLDLGEAARDLPLAILRVLDLARALASEPDVLLLDEMTAALPADLAEKVLDVVRRAEQTGRSVIFISHRLLEISALCDRATVLRDGETVGVVDMAPGAEERIVELMLGERIAKAEAPAAARAAARRRGGRKARRAFASGA